MMGIGRYRCKIAAACAPSYRTGCHEQEIRKNRCPRHPPAKRKLTPAAARALAEAEERRQAREREAKERPEEFGGRKGPDPTRYGDWEKKGILSDF